MGPRDESSRPAPSALTRPRQLVPHDACVGDHELHRRPSPRLRRPPASPPRLRILGRGGGAVAVPQGRAGAPRDRVLSRADRTPLSALPASLSRGIHRSPAASTTPPPLPTIASSERPRHLPGPRTAQRAGARLRARQPRARRAPAPPRRALLPAPRDPARDRRRGRPDRRHIRSGHAPTSATTSSPTSTRAARPRSTARSPLRPTPGRTGRGRRGRTAPRSSSERPSFSPARGGRR